jgi:hypothetical protein
MPKSRICLGDWSIAFISLMISDMAYNRFYLTSSFMPSGLVLSNGVGIQVLRSKKTGPQSRHRRDHRALDGVLKWLLV